MSRQTRIRELAEQLLRGGEAPHWGAAYAEATRRVQNEERGGAPEEVTEEALLEASRKLFGNDPPRREVSDQDVAEATGRLFPGGRR